MPKQVTIKFYLHFFLANYQLMPFLSKKKRFIQKIFDFKFGNLKF